MIAKSFTITSQTGIHSRPATILVNEAVLFESDIFLKCKDTEIDLKSIMGIMSLGIYQGETITIRADGIDEEEALETLKNKLEELNLGVEL